MRPRHVLHDRQRGAQVVCCWHVRRPRRTERVHGVFGLVLLPGGRVDLYAVSIRLVLPCIGERADRVPDRQVFECDGSVGVGAVLDVLGYAWEGPVMVSISALSVEFVIIIIIQSSFLSILV